MGSQTWLAHRHAEANYVGMLAGVECGERALACLQEGSALTGLLLRWGAGAWACSCWAERLRRAATAASAGPLQTRWPGAIDEGSKMYYGREKSMDHSSKEPISCFVSHMYMHLHTL